MVEQIKHESEKRDGKSRAAWERPALRRVVANEAKAGGGAPSDGSQNVS